MSDAPKLGYGTLPDPIMMTMTDAEKLAIAVEALSKIAIEDTVNTNFSQPEKECAYYINVAKGALEKIGAK